MLMRPVWQVLEQTVQQYSVTVNRQELMSESICTSTPYYTPELLLITLLWLWPWPLTFDVMCTKLQKHRSSSFFPWSTRTYGLATSLLQLTLSSFVITAPFCFFAAPQQNLMSTQNILCLSVMQILWRKRVCRSGYSLCGFVSDTEKHSSVFYCCKQPNEI